MVCLDSSFVIDFLRGKESARVLYKKLISINEVVSIPSPVIMEIISGAHLSRRKAEEIEKINEFLESIITLNFDKTSAILAGEIESNLVKEGNQIENEDIMIGAIALQNNETLVTGNAKHFERIKGLKIESY
ncbi:MAG: type II toxin-antitoxin system VapC family toxin [archaeon]|nr:type II toxin-antitoxin system VapC family toxin [archaeon]